MPSSTEPGVCCVLTYRTAAKLIGWITLVLGTTAIVLSILTIYWMKNDSKKPNPTTGEIILAVTAIGIAAIKTSLSVPLLIGSYMAKARMVSIWLKGTVIYLIIKIIYSIVVTIWSTISVQAATSALWDITLNMCFIIVVYYYYRELQSYTAIES